MAKGKRDVRQFQGPGPRLRGLLMLDEAHGQLRIRKWPRKRPGRRHPTSEWWSEWLRQANTAAKYAPADTQRLALEATRHTALMPRDLFIMAGRGTLYSVHLENDFNIYPKWAWEAQMEALDTISQYPGSLLVRDHQQWEPILAGEEGYVLTSTGTDSPPIWAPIQGVGGGGGRALLQQWDHDLTGNTGTITFDNIPGNYRELLLDAYLRTNRNAVSQIDRFYIQVGTDSSWFDSTAYSYMENYVGSGTSNTYQGFSQEPVAGWTSNVLSLQNHTFSRIILKDYATPTGWRMWPWEATSIENNNRWSVHGGVTLRNHTAILTRLRIRPVAGTTFTRGHVRLYGIEELPE